MPDTPTLKTSSLAEMARQIERRRKGTLPPSLAVMTYRIGFLDPEQRCAFEEMPDDFAHAILRDAMVMGMVTTASIRRLMTNEGWQLHSDHNPRMRMILDADHGNCPTRSLFAAFCAVFPEPKETT